MRTVLIVDRDLGFVFWLGQILNRAGYRAFPAKTCEDAVELLSRLNLEIHLLIVDGSMAGAVELAGGLRCRQTHLKVIALTGEGEERSAAFPGADASHRRCSSGDATSQKEWLAAIEGVFARTSSAS
jgi:DNA-binding NtrC family response regulator